MRWPIIFCTIAALGLLASAQGADVGRTEYRASCASCHGTDGKGDGPVRQALKIPPPDLTVLAKNNKGVFPYDMVYETIDGRHMASGHGTREMPVWGYRFGPPQAFHYKQRMLAVIDYLKRIQEK